MANLKIIRLLVACTLMLVVAGVATAHDVEVQGTVDIGQADYPGSTERVYRVNAPGNHIWDHPHGYYLRFGGTPPGWLKSGQLVRVHGHEIGNDLVIPGNAEDHVTLLSEGSPVAAVSGDQKMIVILFNFQDKALTLNTADLDKVYFSDPNSVNLYYQACSYGTTSFSGNVCGPYTINFSSTGSCDYYGWANAADSAATAAGINLANFSRRAYIFPSGGGCGWAGLGTLGGNPSRSWINGYGSNKSVCAHEAGHNLGMHHASTTSAEYGDSSDVMGNGYARVNAPHMVEMGWMPSSRVKDVAGPGTYTISNLEELTANVQVLRIPKADTNENYYFSYRVATGPIDSTNLSTTFQNKVSVHRWSRAGVQTFSLQQLSDGGTFTDVTNGISVTMISHDATTATLSVNVECHKNAPIVSLSPATGKAKPGTAKNYTVYVQNKDSALCGASNTFNLSANIPAGFTSSLPSTINVAAGGQASVTFSLTAPAGTADGPYAFSVSVSDADPVHTVSASGTHIVDSIAPTVPQSVKGVWSGKNINLQWTASTDAVSSYLTYTIFANGKQVGTSTYPGFSYAVRGGKVSSYSFEVQAQDEALNVSAKSAPVIVTK